jgi:phenylpropionate dioxygenase-like ring-hydroxylating dioxygenase large terminal subunit
MSISEDVQTRVIAHLKNDTTDLAESDLRVPVAHYVSPERALQERALFRRLPVVAAHASELPEAGDFVTRDLLGTPILLVRQSDGSVKGFLNMCRHRGAKVELEPSGGKRVFSCSYHGWSYERDGALRHVPYESSFEPIDRACNSLKRVKAEERHGFIWVDLSNSPGGGVADFLGPQADAQLGLLGIEAMTIVLDKTFTLDINWKLVADGAIDITHPQFLHPNGVGTRVQGNIGVWQDYGRHGQLFTPRKRLADKLKAGETVDRPWRYFSTAMVLFPNNIVIAAPDHIEYWSFWPSETGRTSTTHIRFLARPEILDEVMRGRIAKSWEVLWQAASEEDWPIEATIQANAQANPEGSFLYGRSELSCQHLHRQLAQELDGV